MLHFDDGAVAYDCANRDFRFTGHAAGDAVVCWITVDLLEHLCGYSVDPVCALKTFVENEGAVFDIAAKKHASLMRTPRSPLRLTLIDLRMPAHA